MMGKSHSLSGAALGLTSVGVYSVVTHTVPDPILTVMWTVVFAGASLIADHDSWGSTANRSFGVLGRVIYWIVNALGLVVYNTTKTAKDEDKNNGHRTFLHTTVAAILAGGLTALATLSTGDALTILGKTYTWGSLFGLLIFAYCLNLAVAGLFSKQIKKAKTGLGVYVLMAGSVGVTLLVSRFLPESIQNYSWLGLAVGLGYFVHLLGDGITKMGVPFVWPMKVRSYRWYNLGSPHFMRFTAGGEFEQVFLVRLFIAAIFVAGIWDALLAFKILPV